MFTGIASITTNSFAINVDVTDTSVGFLSARIQCSLAAAGFFPHYSWRVWEISCWGGGEPASCMLSSSGVKKGRSAFKCNDPWFPSLPQSWLLLPTLHTLLQPSKIKDRFPHSQKLSGDPQFSFIYSPTWRVEGSKKTEVLICYADKPRILRLSCVSNDAN